MKEDINNFCIKVLIGFFSVAGICVAILIVGVFSTGITQLLGISKINIIWIAPTMVGLFYLIGYLMDTKIL